MFGNIFSTRPALPHQVAKLDAQAARRRAGEVATDVNKLEDRVDHLALACMAMWSLLREKTDLTEDDLLERIKQIDLADGKEDGKVRAEITECPECGRTLSRRHRQCMYCGCEKLTTSGFDNAK